MDDTVLEIAKSGITRCYHDEYPYKNTFYFLLPSGYAAMCYATHELKCRIHEILAYSSFIIKTEGYIWFPYPDNRKDFYPELSLSVRLSRENYKEICEFLKAYEVILDQQEELEPSFQLKKIASFELK